MTKFVVTDCGEALTLTKCDRATVIFDGRFEERAIYVADDGSYWAQLDGKFRELAVREWRDGKPNGFRACRSAATR